jgi:fatty acid desaturase
MELPMSVAPAVTAPSAALRDEDVLTEGPTYNQPPRKQRVAWYRCPVPRDELSRLNKRSDLLGFAQTLGFLGVLATGCGATIYASLHWPWYVTALLVFVNGHVWHFLINGFHELIHDSVFRTRWLNRAFLRVFSFLGWHDHHWFWASHTEHHKYTLHPPDDLEVVLPISYTLRGVLKTGLINVHYPYRVILGKVKASLGRINLSDPWTASLFPDSDPQRRLALIRWARIQLLGHTLLLAAALAMGWWIWPLVFTFPMIFGSWLHFLCNSSQHTGLQDNVPDFRLCCRTIYLNPILQFLYWHMNYHTEHHMYAAVPCYKLGRLHRLIRHDMPECPRGLVATWLQIADILKRQKLDPAYKFSPALPSSGTRRDAESHTTPAEPQSAA